MEINELIHGFRLLEKTEIKEKNGILYEFEHAKTKAKLCWFERDDTNKTFSVAFKTTPENDTGVFHILEHSVLNGSKKYPVKEPFVELLKSSLQTFLNAMTYPDKTVYPVSSRNEKDFMNLMSVYMDAVFQPSIYENPNIFYQEGWHYEIRKEEDDPIFKGVVFNEMKGAFSSVDTLLVNELNRQIYPDNCYRFVSGGDPEKIPDLSYEEFIETHRKYYHPSNAYFFLDGAIDINKTLAFINDEYLCHYEFLNVNFDIAHQELVSSKKVCMKYEISDDEDTNDKAYLALGKIVSRYDDVKQNVAWNALAQVLVGSNESPFQKKIIEAGLGQSVDVLLYDGIEQPCALLVVNNSSEEKLEEAYACIQKTAKELVQNGLDHDELYAILNQMEFAYREPKTPAGLQFVEASLSSWLYGGKPSLYLSSGNVFYELKSSVEAGYFESLLESFLLDEKHLIRVDAIPDREYGKQRVAREKERLETAKASWTNIGEYIKRNEEIDLWQAKKDTKEELATLPVLSLTDVDEATKLQEVKKIDMNGAEVLIYPKQQSGIVYINMYFSLAGLKREDLSAVSFFAGLFKELPTKNFTVQKLQAEIKRYLGSLVMSPIAFYNRESNASCTPAFAIRCKVLEENLEHAISLIKEILTTTKFDKDLIRAMVNQELQLLRQALIQSGSTFAGYRTGAHFSAEAVANEYFTGYAYREYVSSLLEESTLDRFIGEFELFQSILFARTRLTMSFTGEENQSKLQNLVQAFPFTDAVRAKVRYPLLKEQREGVVIPSQVSYSTSSSSLSSVGGTYNGSFAVLSNILTYSYLWNEIRVKGGAYGTRFNVDRNGTITCMSYRDPSPMNSLAVYRGCGEFVRSFLEEIDSINSFIIGSVATTDPLLSVASTLARQDAMHFIGTTYEDMKTLREEILATTKEDLLKAAELFDQSFSNSVDCVVGPQEVFQESQFQLHHLK